MSYAGMAHHAYQQIGFAMVKVIVQMAVMKSDVPVKYELINDITPSKTCILLIMYYIVII